MQVVIIGGGVAAAVALRQRGMEGYVCEPGLELREVALAEAVRE